jgi:large subunit ribosomal protein L13
MQLQRITKHTKRADLDPKWHVMDADGERLGRMATRIAGILQGKHRADYSRHQIVGDFVIVVNARTIGTSGTKLTQKIYYRHTGYIGHLRSRTLAEMLERFPERVIEQAVKGMLPRNRLGRQMLRRLKVYADDTHPHEAQVNAGTGKAKQAPEAPATPPRRRRAAAPEAVEAPVEEAAAPVEETAAVAVAEPEAPAAQEAVAEKPARAPRKRRAPAAAKQETPAEEPQGEGEDD